VASTFKDGHGKLEPIVGGGGFAAAGYGQRVTQRKLGRGSKERGDGSKKSESCRQEIVIVQRGPWPGCRNQWSSSEFS